MLSHDGIGKYILSLDGIEIGIYMLSPELGLLTE